MAGNSRPWWSWLACGLVGVGLATAGYLLHRTFALLEGGGAGSFDVCSVLLGGGCDAALGSANSWQFGIPLAGWGLVLYCTLAGLLALSWWLGDAFRAEALLAALVLASLAAVGSLWLAAAMLIGRWPLCPLCLVVHGVNLALVPVILKSSGRTLRENARLAAAGGRYLLGQDEGSSPSGAWKPIGFLAAALIAVVAYQWVFVESAIRRAATTGEISPAEALAQYQAAEPYELHLDASDPRLGPDDAPAQLVVFLSFQCPACAHFARQMRSLQAEFGSHLAITIRHFPLGIECNPSLQTQRQPQACAAARAAIAAHEQGRFWRLHERLFDADLTPAGTLQRLARESDLEMDRFEADFASAATGAKLAADVELARRVGVAETPAVFLNGRRIRHFQLETLRHLIRYELTGAEQGGGGSQPPPLEKSS